MYRLLLTTQMYVPKPSAHETTEMFSLLLLNNQEILFKQMFFQEQMCNKGANFSPAFKRILPQSCGILNREKARTSQASNCDPLPGVLAPTLFEGPQESSAHHRDKYLPWQHQNPEKGFV